MAAENTETGSSTTTSLRSQSRATALACTAPTALAFDLVVPPIVVANSSLNVTIPMGLPPGFVAIQCAMVPLTGSCVDFRVGARVAIRP